ncbi:DUF3089 domain-containing protein [Methanoplanus endosymbiosus]|uniref:DUF3089 domain-containing protein n=1 Tax=Methanoplanus endosymbiosus TaxID=33865 RepID=A0A9E7TL48_9EURY|nr:DUF3089 domain-containing protein [Methanoplanus endosymbiosus]UUX91936.1 DUF3089 domain-containing protein [Methanoplanus endosymbiosus]
MIYSLFFLFVSICLILTAGCTGSESPSPAAEDEENAVVISPDNSVDYSDSSNWISVPAIDKEVDVFYVYPTVSGNETGLMDITNEDERALAEGVFTSQGSVFESNANVYAPYYRQMSTGADMTQTPVATDIKEFKIGAADVEDAFDYYLNNYNEGRPFILAGHSQGTMALMELLKDRFGDDEKLRSQMVAAYLIGYTVTDEDLEKYGLKAAESANDTSVVITYNTQSATSEGGRMLLPGAICINPLNWKTDSTYAPASENLGARFYNDSTGEFLREVANYTGAEINPENGALITEIPEGEVLDLGPHGEGVYHRYDISFWWRNLEENVGERIDAYLMQN